MRQIVSIDGRSDLWFYKENRIEILVNNRYSDSVDFYLVEDYKGKYCLLVILFLYLLLIW